MSTHDIQCMREETYASHWRVGIKGVGIKVQALWVSKTLIHQTSVWWLQSLHQSKVQFMEDVAEKWRIIERVHWMVLDRNAKLKKEYQQMILVSFVYAPKKVQITIKLKTISEYACTNRIQKFQLTLWAKMNPLFPTYGVLMATWG